ncbi:MAG: cation-efflux pump [Chloroflexi bacterium]|nr:MAG: cation-efflux pump [Chloroflexota bacterium]
MLATPDVDASQARSQADPRAEKEKRQAAASSVVAAVLLTSLKLVVGLLTGSLGILAEAAHSALDLVAALVTFFAVRISGQPPDERHLYGHGKVENLSALFETLLLLVTCVWIVYEAIERLFFKTVEIEASAWAFAVMGVSIVVDVSRSRILYAAARKHHSQALEADALHFSTDVWSSSVVIVGLALVWLGERLGTQWAWLAKADAVAALGVALIVVWVSLQLGRRTVAVLLDSAPPGLADQVASLAARVPGVLSVGEVRVRQAGASVFVDLAINVERSALLEEAHAVAAAVDERVSRLIERGDVVVHVDPVRRGDEDLSQTVGTIAALLGLRTHDVHAHDVQGHYYLDLHVEVPGELTLGEAHERVSRLEASVRQELPTVREVQSHIEPLAAAAAAVDVLSPEEEVRLRERIVGITREIPGLRGCHSIQIRPGPGGHDVAFHCLADPTLPIAEAHGLCEQVETELKARIEGLSRVLVHLEPNEDGRGPGTGIRGATHLFS